MEEKKLDEVVITKEKVILLKGWMKLIFLPY